MPAPTTVNEFVDVIRRSGLVPADRLEETIEKFQLHDDEPSKIALTLIQEGLLTNFQARQLLRGRYRGFAIGKYLLLEQLGEGGMGKVFLCEHMLMRRRVAIKVLARELASDPGTIERFQREARAVASLDHPNIVRAHDVDQEGENHFIVMEYVDGVSLHELVRKKGPLDPVRACHFTKQAAIGLQAVTDAGMIHRDIKPGNLLLDRKGSIKVLDLGLARFEQDKRDHITQKFDEGSVLGTADYLSPEQAMNSHQVDIRTDIYSLGATLYFLLTGRPPFEGGTVTQKLLFHQLKEPEPLRKLRPELPEDLIAVVEKMMAKDPARRYQTPMEVAEALGPWTKETLPTPPEDEMPKLCLAAQRAGTPDALPLPNFPSASGGAASFSKTNMSSAETPRSMSSTSVNKRLAPSTSNSGVGQFDPRRSGPLPEKNSSSVVMMSGVHQGVGSSRVGLGESSANLGRAGVASSKSMRGRSSRIGRRKRSRWPWIIGLSVMAIVLALGGWWMFSGPSAGDKSLQELIVSRTRKGDNCFRTITEAWGKRDPNRPGRILVLEPTFEECVRLVGKPGAEAKPWKIEGRLDALAPSPSRDDSESASTNTVSSRSRMAVWKPLDKGTERPLLQIDNVANLTLSGIRLEGSDRTRAAMVVTGRCPGLFIQAVRFDNIQEAGLKFLGASGGSNRKDLMQMSDVYFYPASENAVGILLQVDATNKEPITNLLGYSVAFVTSKKKPLKAGIQISAPTAEVRFEKCVFDGCESGLLFKKVDQPFQPFNVALNLCEFKRTPVALRFDSLERSDRNRLILERNYFFEVPRLAMVEGFTPEPQIQAQWIWAADAESGGSRWFRRRFTYSPTGARVYLNAASTDPCTVWVNGTKVEIPPTHGEQNRVYSAEVTKQLIPGDNVIAVQVDRQPKNPTARPGLLVQLTNDTGNVTPPIVSDGNWRFTNKEVPGWTDLRADEGGWKPVKVVAAAATPGAPWAATVWDSEIRQRFAGMWSPVAKAEGNTRDLVSWEGFPVLNSSRKSGTEMELALRPTTTTSRTSTGTLLPVRGFLLAGPFGGSLAEAYAPENNPSPGMSYAGVDGEPVNWLRQSVNGGIHDFRERFDRDHVSVYALAWITSPTDQDGELHIAADDAVKVWLNGEEVLAKDSRRKVADAPVVVKVRFKKGDNKLLVKVVNHEGDFGLKVGAIAPQALNYSTRREGADQIKGGYLPGDAEKYD